MGIFRKLVDFFTLADLERAALASAAEEQPIQQTTWVSIHALPQRDQYAIAAMQSFIRTNGLGTGSLDMEYERVAKAAYRMADFMEKARRGVR